jgi:competence/damage-inducible protein CinA-like protein
MNHPIAEIFSQGEEVINGQIADTNASWLSQNLVQMGFVIGRHTAVGDNIKDLVGLLNEISQRADFCICTGGLGPTIDDLTAEAVAQAFDKPLQLDDIALSQIEHYFSIRNRPMAASNRKQAFLPQNSIRIDNAQGSAPGFSIKQNRCWFVFLPGVPTEMYVMFKQHVQKELFNRYVLRADKLVVIKTIGIGESDLQQELDNYSLPKGVQLGFRATTEEVQTKLLFPADMASKKINQCTKEIVNMIGDAVFVVDYPTKKDQESEKETSLISVIGQLMKGKRYTLSVLETVSYGLISAKCVGQGWIQNSSFNQDVDLLMATLEIENQGDFIQKASAIANKLREMHGTDLIFVQIYEGSTQQLHHHDTSIILYNTILTPSGSFQNTCRVSGSIQRKQSQAAIRGLDFFRRVLQNKCH